MHTESPPKKRKYRFWIFLFAFFLIISILSLVAYTNFNRLLTEALIRSYHANQISEVYDLSFENLKVNLFEGSIRVNHVLFQAKEKPTQKYPYINSTLRLSADKVNLLNVELFTLLRTNSLELEKILISNPDVQLQLAGENNILFPFKDSSHLTQPHINTKAIHSYKLQEFRLLNATFHGTNTAQESMFEFHNLTLSLNNIQVNQFQGEDVLRFERLDLTLDSVLSNMKGAGLQKVSLAKFQLNCDSLEIKRKLDTLIYHFADLNTNFRDLNIQTADSIHHISLQEFKMNYKNKELQLKKAVFKPNLSDAQLQKRLPYQHVTFSGSVEHIEISEINFESLLYHHQLDIKEILLDNISLKMYKDKLKPINKKRYPEYFGQLITQLKMPLSIQTIKATGVTLYNTERKPDSAYAKVSLKRGKALIQHISNRSSDKPLFMKVEAYIDNKVPFSVNLQFSYLQPSFSFNGKFGKFELADLNALLKAYTPAKVLKGKADEISFSGIAARTHASGSMKFLYHDLKVDLELKQKAKWKSGALAFAANTLLPSSNPVSAGSAPRVVNFHADRDMNKGFINILLKAVLNGVKETLYMSKENKKKHQAELNAGKHSRFKKQGQSVK